MLQQVTVPGVTVRRQRKAADLEALTIWAIRDQKAHRMDMSLYSAERAAFRRVQRDGNQGPSADSAAWGRDSCVRVAQLAEVGTRVDGGPARGIAPRMHPDAEAVMDAINRLKDRRRRGLVLHYAQIGERPDFETGQQRLVGLPAESGAGRGNLCKIVAEWQDTPDQSDIARAYMAAGRPILDRRGRSDIERSERGFSFRQTDEGRRQVLTRWCPVIAEPSLDEIRIINETYAEWHAGMMTVLGELMGMALQDHRVAGFGAPACPWDAKKRLTAPAKKG